RASSPGTWATGSGSSPAKSRGGSRRQPTRRSRRAGGGGASSGTVGGGGGGREGRARVRRDGLGGGPAGRDRARHDRRSPRAEPVEPPADHSRLSPAGGLGCREAKPWNAFRGGSQGRRG